ncbi:MAG: hypothetical protein QOI59_6015 [Gammaproteobacteria bacterium]|jgi:hypothetical protein|nr:hypothetical protein [Gammaproteobacteria bacterium]
MRLLCVPLLIAACLIAPTALSSPDPSTGNSKAVPFTVLATGKAAGQQQTGLLYARDVKTFEKIWSDLHAEGRPPKVNFERRMVVAWVGGGAACDGYKLAHVREDANEVSLEIEHIHQKPGHMCIAMYVPSHLVAAIPKTTKPIKFSLAEAPRS